VEKASRFSESSLHNRWAKRMVLGAALYRAGEFSAAIESLDDSLRLGPKNSTPWEWLFLAMAHHQLGDSRKSGEYLTMAVDWMKDSSMKTDERDQTLPPTYLLERLEKKRLQWYEELELEVLRREAEDLLKTSAAPGETPSSPTSDKPAHKGRSGTAEDK
jgi:tetratricopeptide (TPR) repeat protein